MNVSKQRRRRGCVPAIAILILTTLTAATEAAQRNVCLFEFFIVGSGAGVLCGQPAKQAVIDTSCEAFEPIRYSKADSAETIRQAREHNAAFDALCGDDE